MRRSAVLALLITGCAFQVMNREPVVSRLSAEMSAEDRTKLCSRGKGIVLTIEDLPSSPKSWSPELLRAISCLKPSDARIHLALIDLLRAAEAPSEIRSLGQILASLAPTNAQAHWRLWNGYLSEPAFRASGFAEALKGVVVTDGALHQSMFDAYAMTSSAAKKSVIGDLLARSKNISPKIANGLRDMAGHHDETLGSHVF